MLHVIMFPLCIIPDIGISGNIIHVFTDQFLLITLVIHVVLYVVNGKVNKNDRLIFVAKIRYK